MTEITRSFIKPVMYVAKGKPEIQLIRTTLSMSVEGFDDTILTRIESRIRDLYEKRVFLYESQVDVYGNETDVEGAAGSVTLPRLNAADFVPLGPASRRQGKNSCICCALENHIHAVFSVTVECDFVNQSIYGSCVKSEDADHNLAHIKMGKSDVEAYRVGIFIPRIGSVSGHQVLFATLDKPLENNADLIVCSFDSDDNPSNFDTIKGMKLVHDPMLGSTRTADSTRRSLVAELLKGASYVIINGTMYN